MKKLMFGLAMVSIALCVLATENLEWVYDYSKRPVDVYSDGSFTPSISTMTRVSGDADALDYFNSFWRQTFDLEGKSVYVYRGLMFIIQ